MKIVAKNFIKEDNITEYMDIARNLVEETVTKDRGCVHYELFQDVSNKCIITMIEEWEDNESIAAHMASDHFKTAVAKLGKFTDKPGEINVYQKIV